MDLAGKYSSATACQAWLEEQTEVGYQTDQTFFWPFGQEKQEVNGRERWDQEMHLPSTFKPITVAIP